MSYLETRRDRSIDINNQTVADTRYSKIYPPVPIALRFYIITN